MFENKGAHNSSHSLFGVRPLLFSAFRILYLHHRDDEASVNHKLTEISRSLVAEGESESWHTHVHTVVSNLRMYICTVPVPAMPDQ